MRRELLRSNQDGNEKLGERVPESEVEAKEEGQVEEAPKAEWNPLY